MTSMIDAVGNILLDLSGWQRLNQYVKSIFDRNKKCVLVFSHTSRMDFIIYTLYWLSWSTARRRSVVLVNSYHMSRWGWLCKHFGAISAPADTGNPSGLSRAIVEKLRGKDEFIFLLSPKGTSHIKDWRTGYYYIARSLSCPIIAGGLDYDQHCLCITKVCNIGPETPELVIKQELQESLANITPLHPERSEFKLSPTARSKRPRCFPDRLIIMCLLLVYLIYKIVAFLL